MAVSKRLRYEVMRRDDHACRYCGAKAPDVKLTVDHVIPVALGGGDKPENLVTACAGCNAGKSSSSPDAPIVANVSDDALRWARAMAMAAELAAAQREARQKDVQGFDRVWKYAYEGMDVPVEVDYFRESNWRHSVGRFLDAGLTLEDVAHLAADALGRNQITNDRIWKYFCGMCWRCVEDRQRTARALIDSGEAD